MAYCLGARFASFSNSAGSMFSAAVAMRRVFAELSSVRTASGKIERITLSILDP